MHYGRDLKVDSECLKKIFLLEKEEEILTEDKLFKVTCQFQKQIV